MKPPRSYGQQPWFVKGNPDLTRQVEQVSKVLSNISFGTTTGNADPERNIDCWKATGTTPGVANTEFAIAHSLGRIPVTLAGWDTNNGGVIYRSSTAWTTTHAYFKCTTANANYVLILI